MSSTKKQSRPERQPCSLFFIVTLYSELKVQQVASSEKYAAPTSIFSPFNTGRGL